MTAEQFTAELRRTGFEPHGALHKERYGPSGLRYLVGRK
jgi:hypothetical protein